MTNSSEDLVNVQVPRQHLGAVYRLLGELDTAGDQPAEAVRGSDQGPWTPDLIRTAVQESDAPMRAVLQHLAAHPDEEVPAKDLEAAIAQATGEPVGKYTLAGTLGAFGRRVNSRYGLRPGQGGGAAVPWRSRWDRSYGSRVFAMPKEIAEVVAKV
jgi:hypothetical protein